MPIDPLASFIPGPLAQAAGGPNSLAGPTTTPTQPASGPPELLAWARGTFLGNAVWQWLGLLGVLLAGLVVGKVLAFALTGQARRLKTGGPGTALWLGYLL